MNAENPETTVFGAGRPWRPEPVSAAAGAKIANAGVVFMAMVVGGGIVPLVQNFVADKVSYMASYWVIFAGVAFILYFAVLGSRVKKN